MVQKLTKWFFWREMFISEFTPYSPLGNSSRFWLFVFHKYILCEDFIMPKANDGNMTFMTLAHKNVMVMLIFRFRINRNSRSTTHRSTCIIMVTAPKSDFCYTRHSRSCQKGNNMQSWFEPLHYYYKDEISLQHEGKVSFGLLRNYSALAEVV